MNARIHLIALAVCAITATTTAQELLPKRSNPVSLGDGEFRIEVDLDGEEPALNLRHVSLEGETTVRPVQCDVNPGTLPEEQPIEWRIENIGQIMVAPFERSSLFFAVLSRDEERRVLWAGMIRTIEDDSNAPVVAAIDYVTECEPGYEIISASGIGSVDAISILVGELVVASGGELTEGIVVTAYCAYTTGNLEFPTIGRIEPTYSQ